MKMNIIEERIKKRKIGIAISLFLAIIIVFISGCTTKETICNKPYYEYKTGDCCLDENDNKICDKDEITSKQPETKKCPSSCDDGNKCTNDYCSLDSDYVCKHDLIIPCCGNEICDGGENHNSCPSDCDCTPNWQCSNWSECSKDQKQTRTCTDVNNCGVTAGKPSVSQSCIPESNKNASIEQPETKKCPSSCDDGNKCTNDYCSLDSDYVCKHDLIIPCCGNEICDGGENHNSCPSDCDCTPNWQCSNWSECSKDQKQTRTCTDVNNCGVTAGKPSVSQSCISELNKNTSIVSKVIDGDTIEINTGERVRLIGINAPEIGQPYYEESANRLKQLIEGKTVILEEDLENKDQYGRLLRYIFLGNVNINIKLVREGYATVYIIPPNTKYESELRDAWDECIKNKVNLCKPPEQGNEKEICDNQCIEIYYFHYNAIGNDCNNLNDEYVTFKNNCLYPCDLTGWTVKDEASRVPYTFPSFILDSNATVTLYTGCGNNTNTELYWCSRGYTCNAIWNNDGDTLYLRNSEGSLILNYNY